MVKPCNLLKVSAIARNQSSSLSQGNCCNFQILPAYPNLLGKQELKMGFCLGVVTQYRKVMQKFERPRKPVISINPFLRSSCLPNLR